MRGSDLLSVTTMQARSSPVRDRPWTVRPWVAGVGIFVAVLTLDAVLKVWAQQSLATPVCVTSWMCLAVQHNPGLFLGMVPLAPDSLVSALHWLALPPVLAWLGWRLLTLDSVPITACYALVAGGLVGNLADRAEGAVIDYVGFGPISGEQWAFANLADLALVAGVVWLGVLLVLRRQPARSSPRRASTRA